MSYCKEYCTENHGAKHVLLSDEALLIFLMFFVCLLLNCIKVMSHIETKGISVD